MKLPPSLSVVLISELISLFTRPQLASLSTPHTWCLLSSLCLVTITFRSQSWLSLAIPWCSNLHASSSFSPRTFSRLGTALSQIPGCVEIGRESEIMNKTSLPPVAVYVDFPWWLLHCTAGLLFALSAAIINLKCLIVHRRMSWILFQEKCRVYVNSF